MSDHLSRRAIMKGCSIAGVGLTAGCITRPDTIILSLGIEEVLSEGDPWRLAVQVKNGSVKAEGENPFHEVKLLGYSRDLEEVGRAQVGTVPESDRDVEAVVELECDGFPFVLTFDARETPCDDRTQIDIADYSGKRPDGTHVWEILRDRECGHGLPPRSPDSTVTPPPHTSNE